eukprot:scaffold388_cov380-Prasinococcus_capsulatus_cf.AAC.19
MAQPSQAGTRKAMPLDRPTMPARGLVPIPPRSPAAGDPVSPSASPARALVRDRLATLACPAAWGAAGKRATRRTAVGRRGHRCAAHTRPHATRPRSRCGCAQRVRRPQRVRATLRALPSSSSTTTTC